MKRTHLIAVLLALAFSAAPPLACSQQPLPLSAAIHRALNQNPATRAAQASIDEAKATVSLARSALLPQVSFTEDMSRGNDPVYAFGTRLRQQRFAEANFAVDSLNRPEPIGNFSSRIGGGWQVFDSLKTQRQIAGARHMEQSSAAQALAVDQKIVFDVVIAYQQILYDTREMETTRHDVATAEALLKTAEARVKSGLAVESDRLAAVVNLAACQQALIAAEGDEAMAWDALRLAMGEPNLEAMELVPLEKRIYPGSTLEQDLTVAREHRKDLAAMSAATEAQSAAVSAARLSLGPRVSVYGNWQNDRNTLGTAGGSNWVAGAQITLDLQPQTKRAQWAKQRAAQTRIDAEQEACRQQVRMQVSQAHTNRSSAVLAMNTAGAAVDLARESLRIVKNRYEAGLATVTDLLRAEDAERQSETSYWRAVYGNSISYAQLLFATGTLTPEAAEVLQ